MASETSGKIIMASETSGSGIRKKISKAFNLDGRQVKVEEQSSNPKVSPKIKKPLNQQLSSSSNSDVEDDIHPLEFIVHYLGYAELKSPGFNDICETVNKMYQRAKPYLKTLDKSSLMLTRDGIKIKQAAQKDGIEPAEGTQTPKESENLYKPRRVLYCGVDKQHRKVFSFNYQFGTRAENIHLHVLVCKTKDDARTIAKYLALLFRRISKEVHRKEKEDKQKHSEGLTKSKTKSDQSIHTYSNITYPISPSSIGSKEGSCSGTCGSGEWVPDRISQLSMA